MRGEEGGSRQAKEGRCVEEGGRKIKKEASDEAECERESSDGVIALQRSFEKQHLRASVVW